MGILSGFAPWIVFWALLGNTPPALAAGVSLTLAVGSLAAGHLSRTARRSLETGSAATFFVVLALVSAAGPVIGHRWALAASFAGILLTTAVGRQLGAPFVHEYAAAHQPPAMVNSDVFGQITARLTGIWMAIFAAMTVSASVPPIVAADASMLHSREPVSYLGYWVIPFTLFGLGALATRFLPEWMLSAAGTIERKTTFVAYHEATIDELYYLATEHANREVGAGEEAYAVKVGSMGTPLVGDDSRHSWPSTYKVRPARR